MYNIKILILAISFMAVFIAFYNLFFSKTPKENLPLNAEINYLKANDPNGQKIYDKKNKFLDFFKNKIKNKVELSWQFLYDITDIVLKKFSMEDQNIVSQIGKILFKAGMRYNHILDYGINLEKIKAEKRKITNIEI